MNIGFIGFGNMAKAIVNGMLKAGFSADNIFISDKQDFNNQTKVKQINTTDIAKNCQVIILAVKPQNLAEIATEIKDLLNQDQIIISILAGVSTAKLKQCLAVNNITRLMPNIAATISSSATGIFSLVGKQQIVSDICNSFGNSFWVDNEEDIDSITALSGSGPAYFYLFFEIMIKVAQEMGIEHNTAKHLCIQTAYGASLLARDDDIQTLRENVTSKGGTTEAAIKTMLDMGIQDIIRQAMLSAKNRAKELNGRS